MLLLSHHTSIRQSINVIAKIIITKSSFSYTFLQISTNLSSPRRFYQLQSSILRCPSSGYFHDSISVKKKEEESKPSRPRINEEIKAQYLRLVTDEGHSVVSLNEALSRAKSLELDLVEVDRDAKPPVCKILDFHREKYKKQVREKERAKSKAAGSLRKGTCKEVRISAKTELKDIQLKANMIKRLMERGYRVKCTATGSEAQDLSGLLSQLSDLIEDIAFVEFGPKFESKQAHLMVRHIKFGAGKKGGKKASKDKTANSPEILSVASTDVVGEEYDEESDSNNDDEVEAPTWSATPVCSADQNFDKMFDLGSDEKGATSSHDERMKFYRETTASPENNNAPGSSPKVPSFTDPNVRQETENRYARSAAKYTSGVRNPMRFPNNGSHPQPPPQPHPRLSVPPSNGPQGEGHQPPNSADDLKSQSANFGIFSNPNSCRPSDATRIPSPGVVSGNLNPLPPKSDVPQKSESADKKFGIFSR